MARKKKPVRRRFGAGRVEELIQLMVLPGGEHMGVGELAQRMGVHRTTLRRHLTQAVRDEAARRRLLPVPESEVRSIDRALVEQAKGGHVGAARLVYLRLGATGAAGQDEELPLTEEELEEALTLMRGRKAAPG